MEKKYSPPRLIFLLFALVVGTLIVWHAANVFLLTFAAILLAIFLSSIGAWTYKKTKLPYPLALIASLFVIVGILVLTFWLYSPLITTQFQQLFEELPGAIENLKENLDANFDLQFLSDENLKKEVISSGQKIFAHVTKIFSFTIGSITGFIIFLMVGFYLALDPPLYINGFLAIFKTKRKFVQSLMVKITHSLRWWLLGKIIAMVIIGLLSFIGLWLLNVSLAFVLGLLAGILTFIPYIGPIVAAIPAILLAFTTSPLTALYVVLLYMGIHAVEGYFITPYIEQKTVSMPPALTIMTQILMLVLFGFLGLALATPLFVICIAIFQHATQPKTSLVK